MAKIVPVIELSSVALVMCQRDCIFRLPIVNRTGQVTRMDKRISKYIRRKAISEANQFVFAVNGVGGIMVRLLLLAAYIAVVGYLFSRDDALVELWMVAAASMPVLLFYPLIYLWERDKAQRKVIASLSREAVGLRKRLEPKSSLVIHIESVGRIDGDDVCHLIAQVMVRNVGSLPSCALSWRGLLNIGGVETPLPSSHISELTFDFAEAGRLKFCSEDLIAYRTLNPIQIGRAHV